MAGRFPLVATREQEAELWALLRSDVRGEADRARVMLDYVLKRMVTPTAT
mgnify:CR=1 FL=1